MIAEGAILVTELGGTLSAAVAIGEDRGTLDVLVSGGARQKLKADKIIRVSVRRVASPLARPAEAIAEAERHVEEVRQAAESIDMEGLWEILVEEGDAYRVSEMAELAVPGGGPVADDAMALALYYDRTFFKARKEGLQPNPRRTVDALRTQVKAEQATRREEDMAVDAVKAAMAGQRDESAQLELAVRLLRDYALQTIDPGRERKVTALLMRLFPEKQAVNPMHAIDVLVRLGVFHEDENLDLLRQRIPSSFAQPVTDEAERIALRGIAHLHEGNGRVDLRDLVAVAIDDADTRDVDDALAVEQLDGGGVRVHVLIADVAEVVPLESEVAAEARRRASTLYLPNVIIPMLPRALSEGSLSLEAGIDRLAVDFVFELDAAGAIVGFAVKEALVRIAARLTYTDVDAMLTGELASPFAGLVRQLADIAQVQREARRRAGAVLLQQGEVKVKVAADGTIRVDRIDRASPSRELVAELMIGTCARVGSYCHEHGIPAVYRTQPTPDDPVEFSPEQAGDPVVVGEVLRTMRRAELSLQPDRHYTLGVDAYTQVTSPIRRYQDMVMHAQIKGALREGVAPLGEREILNVFGELESTSSGYGRIERDAKRYFILKYLKAHRSTPVDAIAVRDMGQRMIVELVDYGIQAPFSPQSPIKPGDRVLLAITDVDARRDRLVLSEA